MSPGTADFAAMTQATKIAVLGAGAWGTALAVAFAERHAVSLWGRETDLLGEMAQCRENRRFLPGVTLPAGVVPHIDFDQALAGADIVVVATPVAGLRPTTARLAEYFAAHGAACPVVWVCKGFEAGSGLLPHQVVGETLGHAAPCAVLSGPSFADEVGRGLPTAVALASSDEALAAYLARELHGSRFRIYANADMVGVEVGGAVKNVLAIATGISDGLHLGHNARAALVTRGLAEITRLGAALGAQRDTFMGLAGMGDILLTCTGDLSRNRRVGLALGAGKPLETILAELGHVAEGVLTAAEVARTARRLGVDMPITFAVDAVLRGELAPAQAAETLLARDPKPETL